MTISLKKKLDSQGKSIDAGAIYICAQAFSSEHGGCAAGTRLRGSNEKVQQWPEFIASADLDSDELRELRVKMVGGPEFAWILAPCPTSSIVPRLRPGGVHAA